MVTRLASGLVLLALVCAASGSMDYGDLNQGSLVVPLEEGDLGEARTEEDGPPGLNGAPHPSGSSESDSGYGNGADRNGNGGSSEQHEDEPNTTGRDEAAPPEVDGRSSEEQDANDDRHGNGQAAVDDMQSNIESATDENQVKDAMANTIQQGMKDKKADLLSRASQMADKATEKVAYKNAQQQAEQSMKAKAAEITEATANAENAKATLEKAQHETQNERGDLERINSRKKLIFARSAAEEGAKTAAAERIAAEERAKISAAERVGAEEDAKKAAAIQLTQEEQARASQKTPMELHALEAKAFQQAAALKIREGEALAKVAALKTGDDMKQTENGDVAKEATAAASLHEAKVTLHHLVEQATAALFQAKAKPFDKDALQQVIKMKGLVSQAKKKVLALSGTVEQDQQEVKHDATEINGRQHEDRHPDEERSDSDRHEKSIHSDMQNPDIDNMSEEQIHYWANKKMKWRNEDPLNKNAVMAKIFQIKNMEAATLTRMNEVTSQIGMKPDGIRSAMLGRGQNVIIDGVLVKPNPEFHLNHVFQGQKGRDPKTEEVPRDPNRDALKLATREEVADQVSDIQSQADEDVQAAKAAGTEPFAPAGAVDAPAPQNLQDLRKSVLKNKQSGRVPAAEDEDDEAAEKAVETSPQEEPSKSLGENDDDSTTDDDGSLDAMVEKEDEDALSDDNDVSVAMDETSMEDDSTPDEQTA